MKRTSLICRRKKLQLTQEDIAKAIGVDRSTYVRYETGLRTPSLETAQRLAVVLDSTVEHLFDLVVPNGNEQAATAESA